MSLIRSSTLSTIAHEFLESHPKMLYNYLKRICTSALDANQKK